MKDWRTVAVLLLCVVLAGSMACNPFGGGEKEVSQRLVEVVRGDLVQSVSASGNLSLDEDRKLTFAIPGTITKINVKEDDRVTEGQVLATLDTTSLEKAVKKAEIELETDEFNLKTAEFNLEEATDDFRKITYPYTYHTFAFAVPEAVAAIGDAYRGLSEAEEVLQELGLSQKQHSREQYWDVWQAVKQARDKLAEARAKLARGRGEDVFGADIVPITDFWTLRAAQLEMGKAQLAVTKAQLAVTKAQLALEEAKDDLKKGKMLAPFDGVIAVVNVKEGDNLSLMDYATKTIIELIDPSSLELKAEADEIDVVLIKQHQGAVITIDALPKAKFEGKVTFISSLSEEKADVVIYEVKISLGPPQGYELRSGMSATADIIVAERRNVLLVPDKAIEQDSHGKPMVKVMVNGQIKERSVVTGIGDGLQTEIVEGLNEGETVVIEKRAKKESTEPGFPF